jgi:poly(3-hydroxybutyrate) depolymerase
MRKHSSNTLAWTSLLALFAACSDPDDNRGGFSVDAGGALPGNNTDAMIGSADAGANPDGGSPPSPGATPGMAGGPGGMAGAGADGGAPRLDGGALDTGAPAAGDAGGDTGASAAVDASVPQPCTKNLEPKPGDTECTAPLKPGDDRLCKFMYGGAMRLFYVYAPKSYDPCQPTALIMDCHGATESAEVHVGKAGFQPTSPKGYGSSWRRAVQGDNAIVVTPEGRNFFWNEGSDPAYVNAVADMVKKIADVHPERMYMTGISMGGMMTYANSCTADSKWRGMAPIAMLANDCPRLPKPTPLISFHAPTDSVTSYSDDRANTEKVAKLNNCKSGPKDVATYGGPNSDPRPHCFAMPPKLGSPDAADPTAVPMAMCPTTAKESKCIGWDQCDDGVEVVFCSVIGAGQSSGGHLLYNNDTGLNLPQVAWPFLKKFWK